MEIYWDIKSSWFYGKYIITLKKIQQFSLKNIDETRK